MVNDSLFIVVPHLFVVESVFVKYPLKIRYTFSCFYLFPNFPLEENISDKIFVVVAPDDEEREFVKFIAVFK